MNGPIALVDMVPELNATLDQLSKQSAKSAFTVFLLQNIGILTGIFSLFILAKFQDKIQIDFWIKLPTFYYSVNILSHALAIRNGLIRNLLVLRNYFPWPIWHLLHKDKELLALRNNFRATKRFLIAKFDCTIIWRRLYILGKNIQFYEVNTVFPRIVSALE